MFHVLFFGLVTLWNNVHNIMNIYKGASKQTRK